MRKQMKSLVHYYIEIIDCLVKSSKEEDIQYYEAKLVVSLFSPFILVGGIANLFFGFFWGISKYEIFAFLLIFTISSLASFWILGSSIKSKFKMHLIALCFNLIILTIYQIYYKELYILFWFAFIAITIFASFFSNKIILIYSSILYFILFVASCIQYPHYTIQNSRLHDGILFELLLFINLASFMVNYTYNLIGKKKNEHFIELTEKKQEIISLYEMLLEREDILKEQNEKLNEYNMQLENQKLRLEELAYKDPLTGLPNRKMILEQLQLLVHLKTDLAQTFSIAMIDIDDFKKINDSMGHKFGDDLLVRVIERIQSKLGENDMLGRHGGDELILLIRSSLSGEELYSYIQSICELFEHPFHVASIQTKISISIGVAIWPTDGSLPEDMLKACETAMYKAKNYGKNCFFFYHSNMKKEIMQKLELEQRFIEAMEKEYFSVAYQPIYNANTLQIASFEALLRLETKEYGKITPDVFIPFAEENGFIIPLGFWVIEKVCSKLKELEQKGLHIEKIAINVSPIQIYASQFIPTVKQIFEKYSISSAQIEFEITESVFIQHKQIAFDVIQKLRENGISISMDDFGTGYSSLSYLLELPIDKLKIDRSFIEAIASESGMIDEKATLVGCIIDMAHCLNLSVVAEGIETKEQMNYLKEHSCDFFQGFLLSKPVDETQVEKLLSQNEL